MKLGTQFKCFVFHRLRGKFDFFSRVLQSPVSGILIRIAVYRQRNASRLFSSLFKCNDCVLISERCRHACDTVYLAAALAMWAVQSLS